MDNTDDPQSPPGTTFGAHRGGPVDAAALRSASGNCPTSAPKTQRRLALCLDMEMLRQDRHLNEPRGETGQSKQRVTA